MRDGIVAAFERGRQLGVTVRSRHIPRCMLPGYEDHVVDLREDKVLVVTPRATFALWESKISPNTYAEKCNGCRLPARHLPRAASRLPGALRRRGAAADVRLRGGSGGVTAITRAPIARHDPATVT